MDFLKERGVPIPILYKNSIGSQINTVNIDSKTWHVLLMEFIDGEHKEAYTSELIGQLASEQAKMHKAGIEFAKLNPASSSLHTIKEHEFIHLIDIDSLGNEHLRGLLARGKKYQYKLNGSIPKGYCHLDYDTGNVLADSNDQIKAILDFDDLTYTSVVVCLAFTLWSVLIVNDDWKLLDKYIDIYEGIRPLSKQEKSMIAPIILGRHYALAGLLTLEGDMDNNKLTTYLRIEERLQEFLTL